MYALIIFFPWEEVRKLLDHIEISLIDLSSHMVLVYAYSDSNNY